MSVDEFIKTWQNSTLTERSASQQHFVQLCHLLGEKTPAEVDPDGTFFTFEKAVTKASGTSGRADVWLRNCFIWEYKGKNKDLNAAFVQAQQYAPYLENPPLLIVSDMHRIEIHTNFTSTVKRIEVITLADLRDPQKLNKLKALFDREQIEQVFNPDRVRERITLQMAELFAALAQRLREGKHDPQQVAHFINRLVFCMFAEDIGILPKNLFTKLLESILKPLKKDGANNFQKRIGELFSAMRTGGDFGTEEIAWFNGGLFDDDSTLPLDKTDIEQLLKAASYDWKEIDPSIFGTLFERGLDPNKRSQLGAHYTDRSAILRILEPVIFTPLHQEWQAEKAKITALLKTTPDKKVAKKNQFEAAQLCNDFLMRLGSIQVLDPACGSGNFLYLALLGLKDLERKVLLETAELGLGTQIPFSIHPRNFYGIEINPYAVELARMSIWIGYIQWMLTYNYGLKDSPILETLDNIQCCDALIDENGLEKEWKAVDFIVGNPPFLGDKRMISVLGEEYVFHLRDLFQGRVAGGADLVCYWFEKARAQLEQGKVKNVGLVSTNSIRGGSNRKVLENITATGKIFHAWSDEPWINEGAAVRVSLVCFQDKSVNSNSGLPVLDSVLNNQAVAEIYSDLTAPNSINSEQSLDLTKAVQLAQNKSISFIGTQKNGAFDIAGDLAREWLKTGFNPHGKPNSDVVRPWANGMDVTRRYSDTWIIDFGVNMSEDDASLYEKPFEYVLKNVKPLRDIVRMESYKKNWWLFGCTRKTMRKSFESLSRFMATPRVSKYRLFAWLPTTIVPDCQIVAIARDDDTTFGILHSRFHELWSLRLGTSLEDRPRYTPTTTFETFPFPEGLSPNIPACEYANNPHAQAIAKAAQRLNELRENWLNPPDLVRREPEIIATYPERILPIDEEAAKKLKKRTLTNLYNEKPQWLLKAHENLDKAVASAYGWEGNLSDDEVLGNLLELNLARSPKG